MSTKVIPLDKDWWKTDREPMAGPIRFGSFPLARRRRVEEAIPAPRPKWSHSLVDQSPLALNVPAGIAGMAGTLRELSAPRVTGVYFLIADGAVVYVGQSVNLASRVHSHESTIQFDRVLFLKVPRSELDAVERAFIYALTPKLNTRVTHPGRGHRAVLARFGASGLTRARA